MAEQATIARPYAQAVFDLAKNSSKLAEWSDMFDLLVAVIENDGVGGIFKSQALEKHKLVKLLLDISGEYLTEEGKNFVKLLADNGKLAILPEIARQYNGLKADCEGYVNIEVLSPYDVTDEQKSQIVAALKARLGKEVELNVINDRKLLGGWLIRIGDEVLDLTVNGRLQQLAAELRH